MNVSAHRGACHRLEEILLAGVRDGRVAFDPELFSLLFATADAIEEAGMRLREQQDLADSPLPRCCRGSRPPWEFLHSGPSSRRRAS